MAAHKIATQINLSHYWRRSEFYSGTKEKKINTHLFLAKIQKRHKDNTFFKFSTISVHSLNYGNKMKVLQAWLASM